MFPSQKAASLEARDAFANGLISLEELDERLEKIASSENHTDAFAAITDLQIENEKIRQDAARQVCADLSTRASRPWSPSSGACSRSPAPMRGSGRRGWVFR